MRTLLLAAALVVGPAALAQAQLVPSATGANGGGAAAIDPAPGSAVPIPSIVGQPSESAKMVQVSAGARLRVARETRCTDGTRTWGPVSAPDTHYYCETSEAGATVGVTAAVK